MTTIKYSSELAGFGKTRASILHAVWLASLGDKVVYVSPSIFLIEQCRADIEIELRAQRLHARIPLTAIHSRTSETVTTKVFKDFVAHVEQAIPGEGEILLVTHHTFRKKNTLRRRGWTVVHDEEAAVVEHVQVRMCNTHRTITDHLVLKSLPGSSTHSFVAVSRSHTAARERSHREQLEHILRNERRDAGWDIFHDLLSYVLDSNCRVVTTNEVWRNLLAGELPGAEADFCCLVGPQLYEGYDSTTITCALFPYTMNYLVWTRVFGAELERSMEQRTGLRCHADHHPNSHRFEIYSAYAESWTDYGKGQPALAGTTRMQLLVDGVEQLFGTTEYAWCANVKDNPLPLQQHAKHSHLTNRLPALPHGMNGRFECYNNIAVLGAYNYAPFMVKCLEQVGIDRDAQEVARNFLTWYQQIMRFAARDPHNTASTFRVVVPTSRFAVWAKEIAAILPQAVLCELPGTAVDVLPAQRAGRPRLVLTQEQQAAKAAEARALKAERNARDFQKKKAEKAARDAA